MVREHAITVKDQLSIADLDYLIQKSNRLGITQRKIYNVFCEEDHEGKHFYFEVQSIKNQRSQ